MYELIAFILSALFAYETRFTDSLRYHGAIISNTEDKSSLVTPLQDAITPPWKTTLAIFIYISLIFFVVYCFYSLGWKYGIAYFIGIFISSAFIKIFYPKPESKFFHNIIIHSLMNRYTDYKKEGDNIRASAVAELLGRFDIEIPEVFK